MIWHFTKRIFGYDAIFSAAGAGLTMLSQGVPLAMDPGRTLLELLVRFSIIACSAGYAFSVFLYLTFRRNEAPIYLNGGMYIETVIALSWGFLTAGLSTVVAIVLVSRTLLSV